MIEKAVRLIMQRLRAAGLVIEDQTDDQVEVIIRKTLKETIVFVELPKITGNGGAGGNNTFTYPTLTNQPPLDEKRAH